MKGRSLRGMRWGGEGKGGKEGGKGNSVGGGRLGRREVYRGKTCGGRVKVQEREGEGGDVGREGVGRVTVRGEVRWEEMGR